MKTSLRLVLMLAVLAVMLGGIFGWKYLQQQKQGEQRGRAQAPTAVEAVAAQRQSWRPGLSSVGSVRAVNGVDVANEVDGVVSEIAFESGQRVSRGDVLIRLDDSVDQAALAALEAQAQLTRETFDRYSDLVTRNAVSQSQYDEARANHQAARANVEQQRAQLQKKTVRAPFDGVLGLRRVDLGEYIGVGTAIVDLNMLDPIYVDYSVPESQLREVAPGRTVEVRVAAFPDRVFRGKVLAQASSVSESSRTLRVRARLENPEHALHPGMFADVSTLAPEPRSLLTLPRTALSFNTYGDFVFQVVENEQGQPVASRRQVTTGTLRGEKVEIVSGLQEGDRVVATGQLRLRDGQPIKVVEAAGIPDLGEDEPAPGAAPAAAAEEQGG